LRARGLAIPPLTVRTLDSLRTQLTESDLVLDLTSLHQGIAALTVRAASADVSFVPWERAARLAFLDEWRRALTDAAHADVDLTVPRERRAALAAALDRYWAEFDERLWRGIGKRAQEFEGVERVIVIPHRELLTLPFWQVARWAPQCRVSVLPSYAALELLAARTRTGQSRRAAVGDVTGRLPLSKREIAAVPGVVECHADTATLLRTLPDSSIIHFAGHGYFDQDNPYLSGLAVRPAQGEPDPFSRADPWGSGNCELMTVAQIVGDLSLPNCYLVVLSACETALPRVHPASEFTSLPAAFLIAGARNAIASLWPAHDGAALLMMRAFYRHFDQDRHHSASRSLAAARQDLAGMTRESIVEEFGDDWGIPDRAFPFDAPIYMDSFQHYGPD
jgi:hypothetical protein